VVEQLPSSSCFDRGCDAVVLMTMKGESEGGLYRHRNDWEHVVKDERVIVIRRATVLPLGFIERRWTKLAPIARSRERSEPAKCSSASATQNAILPPVVGAERVHPAIRTKWRRYFSASDQPLT